VILLGSFAAAMWIPRRAAFAAIPAAIGLALAVLILTGLALAVFGVRSSVPLALALAAVTLAAAWAGARYPGAGAAELGTPLTRAGPMAAGGALLFAAAAVLAVRYSAASATADTGRASSLAVWAYPSGQVIYVGARQPQGHGPASLRIVVTHDGVTAAAWNHVRLAPGQTWRAPPLTLTGSGTTRVVARRGGVIVARFSTG